MKYVLMTSLALACAGFVASTSYGKPVPKFVKKDAPYGEALRNRLKRNGWVHHGTALRQVGTCLDSDERCVVYPEAEACSGTGLGFCSMIWKHRDGTLLVVTTAGENSKDLTITNIARRK
jgi:hypothetical protein